MAHFLTLDNLNAQDKRVLVRLDLNLPMIDGVVTDMTRLERSLPTLKELSKKGAKVIVISHLGRPKGVDKSLSLSPVAHALKAALAPIHVGFCEGSTESQVCDAINKLKTGEILLLENIRFNPSEEKNDPTFAKEMAGWGDVYVNDAFSTSHRAHVSTEAIAHLLPSFAGRLMEKELQALQIALESPKRPMMAIIGGAKVSTKLPLLQNLLPKVDVLVIGGAMANTFLAALGHNVGESFYEPDLMPIAKDILAKGRDILLPRDVIVSTEIENPNCYDRSISDVKDGEKIFDIGPATISHIFHKMSSCHTVLWNGPLGVFEHPPFDKGTNAVAQAVAHLTEQNKITSVAGGGDTVAALMNAGVADEFSYVSTAGGAFLEWLEGKDLPGIKALMKD